MNWQQNMFVYVNIFKGTAFVNLSEHPFQGGINHEGTLKVFTGLTVVHTAHLDASLGNGVGWLEAYMVSWERFLGADPTLLFSFALLVSPRHSFSPFLTFFFWKYKFILKFKMASLCHFFFFFVDLSCTRRPDCSRTCLKKKSLKYCEALKHYFFHLKW